jgi:hypothetical protein
MGELWIIDFKTSNHLQSTYDLQAAIYGQMYEECYGKKADRYGVLWLKSNKRRGAKVVKCKVKDGKCMNHNVHKKKILTFL